MNEMRPIMLPIQKEAAAILSDVRKWRIYLLQGNRFSLVTDQRALFFIFKKSHINKTKKATLSLRKLELRAMCIFPRF